MTSINYANVFHEYSESAHVRVMCVKILQKTWGSFVLYAAVLLPATALYNI